MMSSGKGFDSFAEAYDRWYDSPKGGVLFRMEVAAIRPLMNDLRKPFLEIGVGTGRFAKELEIDLGIDPSPAALAIAARRGISVTRGVGEDLPFADESFGCVFIIFTLCFVEDPVTVLKEAKRVLKKDGGLILGFINRESPWGTLYVKKKGEGHPIYKEARFYSMEDISTMLSDAGMSIRLRTSTLLQPPSQEPYDEATEGRFSEGAGFVCILAKKSSPEGPR